MTTDRYTRLMLTIIAACLVWLCVRDQSPPAYAQTSAREPLPVVLVGIERRGFRWEELPLQGKYDRPVNVKVVNTGSEPVPIVTPPR